MRQSRRAQLERRASILDFVREDAARLVRAPGRQRIGARWMSTWSPSATSSGASPRPLESTRHVDAGGLARPAGIPDSFADHVRMMIDLQVLAMQADLTRVCSFMMGRELSNRTYPEVGVPDAHHMLSHHGGDAEKIAKLARINRLHMQHFAYYLERMKATADGEGSLLDGTLVLAGASLGEPNEHDNMNLPIIVAGGGVRG